MRVIVIVIWIVSVMRVSLASAQPPTPFFELRKQSTEYVGPGREEADAADGDEVLIAYFGPNDTQDSVHGQMWQAAELAIQRANRAGGYQGKPFRLLPVWSKDPWGTGVAQLTRAVYREQVWAIIGGIDGPTTHLAEQVVAKARLPLISPVATDQTVSLAHVPWMFSLAPGDHLIAPPLAAEINRQLKDGELMILSADDHDSHHLTKALSDALAKRKVSPGRHITFQRGKASVAKLVESVPQVQPRCLVVIADAADSARTIVGLRKAGFAGTVFGGPAIGRQQFMQNSAEYSEGVVFPLLFDPKQRTGGDGIGPVNGWLGSECEVRVRSPQDVGVWGLAALDPSHAHRQDPEFSSHAERIDADIDLPDDFDWAAVQTYDAANLAIDAIRQSGLNRVRIGDSLRRSSPWQGVCGEVRWDRLGSNVRPVSLGIIRNGSIETDF